jgi:hypothetical protein
VVVYEIIPYDSNKRNVRTVTTVRRWKVTFLFFILIAEKQMQKGTEVKYSKCAATIRDYKGNSISDEEIIG